MLVVDSRQFAHVRNQDRSPDDPVAADDFRAWGFDAGRALADRYFIETQSFGRAARRAWIKDAFSRLGPAADEFRRHGFSEHLIYAWTIAAVEGFKARRKEIASVPFVIPPLAAMGA